jgi:formylglycine-generating enzyme required for sulfatase activity
MVAKTFIQVVPDTGLSFKLCLVEGGSFNMGSDYYESEQPIHPVTLPSFYLAEYTVTQALWLAVVGGENPSTFPGSQRPVENVSWYDAAAFCNHLNLHCSYPPMYFSDPTFKKSLNLEATRKLNIFEAIPIFSNPAAKGFRLPTEAEWEYAARGGNKSGGFHYAGGDKLDEVGWYSDNSHHETKAVGLKLANELGLYDLSGNVLEWCADQWHDNYQGAPKDGSAWLGLEDYAFRVQRGASCGYYPQGCPPSNRQYSRPAIPNTDVGFRVVLGSPPGS